MDQPPLKRLTYLDYLQLEHDTEVRHEFLEGVAIAMAGGSLRHSALKTELAFQVRHSMGTGPCRPYDADAKVRVLETDFACYPDLSVVCGPLETHPDDRHALTNPRLLVEVLSKSTEAWDRGEKFAQYRHIESLEHYLLVSTNRPHIEHFAKGADGIWSLRDYGVGDTLSIADLGISLDIDALYRDLPDEPREAASGYR